MAKTTMTMMKRRKKKMETNSFRIAHAEIAPYEIRLNGKTDKFFCGTLEIEFPPDEYVVENFMSDLEGNDVKFERTYSSNVREQLINIIKSLINEFNEQR